MKIYIIAGENSGDFIGGLLIEALKSEGKERFGDIQFHGVGGQQMELTGLNSLFPLNQINLMGFVEVLPHVFRINKLINETVEDILVCGAHMVITIDSPGFTFRVAKKIRDIAPHVKLVHIVAPSVWAYKPGRAKKYAKIYDHMFALLPFEPNYFTEKGMSSICIGHPVLEQAFYSGSMGLREEMKIDNETKAVAVTPGSRRGEISRHMPIIRKVFDELSTTHKIQVIFVQSDESNIRFISKFLAGAKFSYSFSMDRLKAFAVSDCALAKSGTNTLEIAASGTPMIVGYKLHPITFAILKLFIKVKYASLINIIPDREIIPEYIQSDFTVENIVLALSELLSDPKRSKSQVAEAQKVLQSIGLNSSKKPSIVAAKIILSMI
jgi:lipid-A-disaccharide synthase